MAEDPLGTFQSIGSSAAVATALFFPEFFEDKIVLLGTVALRTGTTLHWDGPNMKATNAPELDSLLRGHHRKGWEI